MAHPPEIVRALGPFDLDPCAPRVRPWDTAARHFTILDNGLRLPWEGRVWLNPPYGKEASLWMGRMAEHNNGIALIFARTETDMWHRHVWPVASGILFPEGRLSFYHVSGIQADANAGAPSAFIAHGRENADRLQQWNIRGCFVDLEKCRPTLK